MGERSTRQWARSSVVTTPTVGATALLALFSLWQTACDSCGAGDATSSGSAAEAGEKTARPEILSPLDGPSAVELAVEGFEPAAAHAPLGATEARPVLIALHGDGADPRANCKRWSEVVPPGGFILCPRGAPRPDSGKQPHEVTAQKELRAALSSLKEKFGHHVGASPAVLVGIGAAAPHAMTIAMQQPEFFAQLVIADGGYKRWTAGMAKTFDRRGGRRVLFVCTAKDCPEAVARPVTVTRSANVETRLIEAGDSGKQVFDVVAAGWSWLVERAPDWRRFSRHEGEKNAPSPNKAETDGAPPDAGALTKPSTTNGGAEPSGGW